MWKGPCGMVEMLNVPVDITLDALDRNETTSALLASLFSGLTASSSVNVVGG